MMKGTVLLGILALSVLAACSREAPTTEEPATAKPAASAPKKPYDANKMSTGLASLLSDAPECQSFRDRLAEAGRQGVSANDMTAIVTQAHDAGCSRKSEKKQ
jgi:hypothetical protein